MCHILLCENERYSECKSLNEIFIVDMCTVIDNKVFYIRMLLLDRFIDWNILQRDMIMLPLSRVPLKAL